MEQQPEFIQRIIAESNELSEKRGKLTAYLQSPKAKGLSLEEVDLLTVQEKLMDTYEAVLNIRLGVYGVENRYSNLQEHEVEVLMNKQLRTALSGILSLVKGCPLSRERSLTATKIEEATMWLGMDLKRLG